MVNKKKTKKKSTRISREAALERHYQRPRKARIRDECETNKTIHKTPTKGWSAHPNKSDVLGIDVPTEVDAKGHMKVTTKSPAFCLNEKDENFQKTIKGRKINPIYDPTYKPDEE